MCENINWNCSQGNENKYLFLIILNLQKKTAKKGDSSSKRSNILVLTASISSFNSRTSSSQSHSSTEISFCRSPKNEIKNLTNYLFVLLNLILTIILGCLILT